MSCARLRHFETEQPLRREAEGMLLIHRRDIIEPVEIRDRLQIGLLLDQFFGAAMQQSDMRIDALDDLAVELQHQAQHAMRRRMLRPEIDREIALGCSRHGLPVRLRFTLREGGKHLRAGHVFRLVGKVVISRLLVDENLVRERKAGRVVERLRRNEVFVAADQTIEQGRAALLAEGALRPVRRAIPLQGSPRRKP